MDSYGFTLLPLQKYLLFKKIYKKDFRINPSFWLLDHNAELVTCWRILMGNLMAS